MEASVSSSSVPFGNHKNDIPAVAESLPGFRFTAGSGKVHGASSVGSPSPALTTNPSRSTLGGRSYSTDPTGDARTASPELPLPKAKHRAW